MKRNAIPSRKLSLRSKRPLQALKSDTRRIGARRVPEYEEDPTEIPTGGWSLVDHWDCGWRMSDHELYYSQYSYPLGDAPSITEGLKHWSVPAWG